MRPKKYKTKNERLLAQIYHNMKARCTNPKVNGYKYYGGKGICVCDSWLRDPLNFIKWGIESGFAPGLSIDRIDSDKGYFPENCQWLTILENNGKQKRNPLVGPSLTLLEEKALNDLWDKLKNQDILDNERILRVVEQCR